MLHTVGEHRTLIPMEKRWCEAEGTMGDLAEQLYLLPPGVRTIEVTLSGEGKVTRPMVLNSLLTSEPHCNHQ